MPLEDDQLRHLTAAQGYVELGMHLDANTELEELDAEVRHVPEVLTVRVQVYRAREKWELMWVVARKLAQYDPDDAEATRAWAFAARRAECIETAKSILLDAVERLPHVAGFHFDLACLECQLGDVEVAKARLAHAFKLDPKLRLRALDEADLAPVWNVRPARGGG